MAAEDVDGPAEHSAAGPTSAHLGGTLATRDNILHHTRHLDRHKGAEIRQSMVSGHSGTKPERHLQHWTHRSETRTSTDQLRSRRGNWTRVLSPKGAD